MGFRDVANQVLNYHVQGYKPMNATMGLLSSALPSPYGDAVGLLSDAAGYAQDPKSLTVGRGLLSLAALAPGIPSMRVFHGSSEKIKKFSDFQPNFFNESADYASGYAGKFGGKGHVLEAEVQISKPFDTAQEEARKLYNEEFLPFAKREFGDEAKFKALSPGETVPFTTAHELWTFLRRGAREGNLSYDGIKVGERLKGVPDSIVPLKADQISILGKAK